MTHQGMLGEALEAVEIQAQTGYTIAESFAIQRAAAVWRMDMAQAIAERALIPFDRLH
jgi:hypothetical protein